MERVQRYAVSEAEEEVGGLAGVDRSMDHHGYGSGVAGFSAHWRHGGCACAVAFGDSFADRLVVQVSDYLGRRRGTANRVSSFMIKDAQEDMQGTRLKA